MSVASLVLGIIGIITAFTGILAPVGLILVVVGLILGIVDVVKKGKIGGKKGIGIAGIVICAIMVVTLLIESAIMVLGVGIYMMNSASTLDSSDLDVQAGTTFNSKFLNYVGRQGGTATKQLLSVISSNNILYPEHTVTCMLDGSIEYDLSTARTKIFTSRYYQVSFSYDSDGYVNRVNITTQY